MSEDQTRTCLFVIHYPVFGGPHNQALRLNEPLRRRGWETVVVLPEEEGNAKERLTEAGVPTRTLPLHRLRAKLDPRLQWRYLRGFISEVRGLREVIREEGADLVMIGGLVNPHAAIAARLEKVPVVWQLIDTRAPHSATLVMMGIVRLLADALLVTGSAVAKMHPGAMSFGDRLVTFFPPVDLEQFQASEKTREAVRAELGFQPTDIVIGSVGNVNPQKGYDRFARAAVKLHDAEPNARFAVFGAEYEQHKEYADGVRELAASGGLTIGDDIVFRDPGSNVAYFASALDLFWMTSEPRSEGIPTVIEEAMALGIPVVAFDVGSVGEAVLDGITGFVVAPEDVDALVASTGRLLSDPALRATFSTASAERAHDSFGLESCTDSHIQVFEAALGHRRRL